MAVRGLRRAAVAAAGVCGVAAVALAVWWLRPDVDLSPWRHGPPPEEWAALRRQHEVWQGQGLQRRVRHEWVSLDAISLDLQSAVLVSEDVQFLRHGSLDLRAISEALREWYQGRRLRGASTISQQLARILFLSPERSLGRKLKEARLAWWMEHDLGKRRILELYLNVVEFAPGIAGAQAAATHFFGVAASEVDVEQAAGLAAAIPAPARDNPDTASPQWTARRDVILARTRRAGWVREALVRLEDEADPTGEPLVKRRDTH